ncbi:winged helix-turn-helix domain-containing protein (plasmid) [Sinorhizobium meliloti]|nr:winged helix-turn-helix domain-containing protein [Sinorhizobium meliloti]
MAGSTVSETIFFLDRASQTGLQAQIRETIVSAVLAGRLAPGAQLPSSRKLAAYLNISRITVTLAYQELASQGYVEAANRSGYRVAGKPPDDSHRDAGRPCCGRCHRLVGQVALDLHRGQADA